MRKKLLSLLALLCLTVSSACADENVNCGDGVTWSYNSSSKTLTISKTGEGSGAMQNYDVLQNRPWNNYIDKIESIVIEDGVTSIGERAFAPLPPDNISNLTTLSIGSDVTIIGDYAFTSCVKLKTVVIPGKVTSIGIQAFYNCKEVTELTIGSGVTSIGKIAFWNCGKNVYCYADPSKLSWEKDNDYKDFQGSSTKFHVFNGKADLWTEKLSNDKIAIVDDVAHTYNMTANLASGAYWSTFYSNVGNYQAPDGTLVFAVNLNDDNTTLTMIPIIDRIVKRGEGVVLKNSTTGSIEMTLTESRPSGDFSSNDLDGTMTEITTTVEKFYYVLNCKSAGVGFYKLQSSGGIIGANKAYLMPGGATTGDAREFFLFEDDDATSIDMPRVKSSDTNDVVYDLQGRRVQNPTKGLYIVNGKKVVIK